MIECGQPLTIGALLFIYCFIVSFLYCLAPSETAAWFWLVAMVLGGIIYHQHKTLTKEAKHRAD